MSDGFFGRPNTTLDDISAVVGFSAALALAAWFGDGPPLYVPVNIGASSVLAKLIGVRAACRMAQEFGGTYLFVPDISSYKEDSRRRRVASLMTRGLSVRECARIVGIGSRRVQQICRELENAGIMENLQSRRSRKSWHPGVNLRTAGHELENAWHIERAKGLRARKDSGGARYPDLFSGECTEK